MEQVIWGGNGLSGEARMEGGGEGLSAEMEGGGADNLAWRGEVGMEGGEAGNLGWIRVNLGSGNGKG